jgi:hypothetical protein
MPGREEKVRVTWAQPSRLVRHWGGANQHPKIASSGLNSQ